MSRPVVDGLERELAGQVRVLRVDILDAANQPFVAAHGVGVVPSFLLFRDEGPTVLHVTGRVPSAAEVRAALTAPAPPPPSP